MEPSPVEWERESLQRVEEVLSEDGMTEILSNMGQEFRGAELSGEHPNTRLIVRIHDRETGEDSVHAFRLWGGFFAFDEDSRMHPDGVANQIAVELQEPGIPFDPDHEVTTESH
jgi:hypothetical protein